jgi:DNA-directed RNA polymerase III subunit RPC1
MESTEEPATAQQVLDQVPKRIKALQFSILNPQQIVSQSVLHVKDRNLFDLGTRSSQNKRKLTKNGPLDERLGTSAKNGECETCGHNLKDCNGHFGYVKLFLPAFHYGYIRKIVDVLNCVCKECSRILLTESERRDALNTARRPGRDSLQQARMFKRIAADCRKVKTCPRCGALNGLVRRVPGNPVKLIHNKFAIYTSSHAKSRQKPEEMIEFEKSFEKAREEPFIERNIRRVTDDMHPLKVRKIFREIPNIDVVLLGMDPANRPEYMIWDYVPAPPVAIRPSVAQEQASTEDDNTNKIGDIIEIINLLKACLTKGQPMSKIMELWEFMQMQLAMYIDGSLPGLAKDSQFGRPMRGFCQRLKGKQGRFRGNLSGKRVDFSGRTVISPDPNLSIEEVAVPERVAKSMTYPTKVNAHNMDALQKSIMNGPLKHPGANFIVKGDNGNRIVLRMAKGKEELKRLAQGLKEGDTVERHLIDGDIVLFNRQPSLHKLSILSHKVKVRPWRTFRLNECVCNPYNADFDGDEMNLHVPQTEEARTEAIELMGVKHNLATPKNGTPIIAAIQDFITGSYLISQKDRFFTRHQFMQVVSFMYDGMAVKDPYTRKTYPIEIPMPAIFRPQRLWTGKQVWNMLMKPNHAYPVNVNVEAKGKQFNPPRTYQEGEKPFNIQVEESGVTKKRTIKPRPITDILADMTESDTYLVVRNSEVMCGALDKATVGDGKKDSIFFVIMRDFGPDYAVAAMNRLAKLSARWLTEQGFSIGVGDVYPSRNLRDKKEGLVKVAYSQCVELIQLFNAGKLGHDPGLSEEETLEAKVSGILSSVREACGKACFEELSRFNAPLTMAKCGSKGSNLNVSQMVAAVGQQIIGGQRVLNGFQDRTLPHFPKASKDPPAKGFVVNSFFSGLTPTEFIFHAMSGREGLVDTAVKTAETGYMSRRLMKSLEDLSAQYDQTVRNSTSGVVQMRFGDDGLDPVDMEGNAKPVNFERTFMHCVASTWNNEERGLQPKEVEEIMSSILDKEKSKLVRFASNGSPLPYTDPSDSEIDQLESVREFLKTVELFVSSKVQQMISNQTTLPGSEKIFKLSKTALLDFLHLCLKKFEKAKVEAGHAVGAVGAQSIGEPGTQMTLKTFHFAGVAGMNLTQGVPRIKEIINASKTISTPVIKCALDSPYEEVAARFAKAIIQKTYLRDIIMYIEDVWHNDGCYINMRIDWVQVANLGLRVRHSDIVKAIEGTKGMKTMGVVARTAGYHHIRVGIDIGGLQSKGKKRSTPKRRKKLQDAELEPVEIYTEIQQLRRRLPNVVVKGYPGAQRAVMKKEDKPDKTGREPIDVFVEGEGLKLCMTTDGIDGRRTTTNNVMETREVLGIEAARTTIVNEIQVVMKDMNIDPRHMQLLADVMTYKGEVLGITRFGMAKMRDSVLQLASFEKTPDHLFEAAIKMKTDEIQGVSECIIMGQSIGLGTGAMTVLRPMVSGVTPDNGRKSLKDKMKDARRARSMKLKQLRLDAST